MSDSKRGFVPSDELEFNPENQLLLRKAQQEILYLLERGYPMKSASTFVGNHYMLSERQRLAIVRATAQNDIIDMRRSKLLTKETIGKKVVIDGLNIIITLEVALSKSTLIRCMDGTIRDLAGLRGTYRIIDKTGGAIQLIGEKLATFEIQEVIFYLDAPVSNTGRLKQKILDILANANYLVTVELVNNPDVILERLGNVVTGDAIILNRCDSWINLAADIIDEKMTGLEYVNLR
jgi:hypothetical protein